MNEPNNIYPLLKYEIKGDEFVRNGPMSPICAANEVGKNLDLDFQHVARVDFNDTEMLQIEETDGLTNYDHLVLVRTWSNRTVFFLFIDMGTDYMPAVYKFSDENKVVTTTIYKNYIDKFVKKPTDDQWVSMFRYMYDNPETYKHPTYDDIMKIIRNKEANGEEAV